MKPQWTLSHTGIGDFKLGLAPPAKSVTEARYFETFIADGIQVKGWELTAPRLRVEVDDAGSVRALRLFEPDVKTEAGLGVGSTLSALLTAYPDLEKRSIPPTLGDDRCNASTSALPDVYFHFESCQAADSGAGVIRVDVWRD